MNKDIFGNKEFIKKVIKIGLPISIQSTLAASLGIIDQVMIGQLGDEVVSGVGFGAKISFLFIMAIFGISSGASIFASQFYGKKEYEKFHKIISSCLIFGLVISIPFIIGSLFFPKEIISLFTNDSLTISHGSKYLQIISIGFIPLLITQTYSTILKSTHIVIIPMIVGIISIFINTFLNYALIFGNLGFDKFGAEGAAIATVTCRIVEMILLLTIIYSKKLHGSIPLKKLLKIDFKFLLSFSIVALPVIVNELLWGMGETIYAGIFGNMGTSESAGIMVTSPIQSLCFSFFIGISNAAGIIIGNKLGEGKTTDAYNYSKHFIAIGILGSIIVGIFVAIFSRFYINILQISPEAKRYAINVLYIFSFLLFVKISNMIIVVGILRSGGRTKLPLFLDLSGVWLIGIPLGLITAFVFKLDLEFVYFFIVLEEIYRFILGLYWVRKKIWIKELTNV